MIQFRQDGIQFFFQDFEVNRDPDLIQFGGLDKYLNDPVMTVKALAVSVISAERMCAGKLSCNIQFKHRKILFLFSLV